MIKFDDDNDKVLTFISLFILSPLTVIFLILAIVLPSSTVSDTCACMCLVLFLILLVCSIIALGNYTPPLTAEEIEYSRLQKIRWAKSKKKGEKKSKTRLKSLAHGYTTKKMVK